MHMVQIATMIYNSFQISHIFTHRLKIGSNSFHLVFHSKQFWEPNLMPKALARKELGKARCSAVQGLGAMRCQICPLLVRLSPLQILQVLQMCLFLSFFLFCFICCTVHLSYSLCQIALARDLKVFRLYGCCLVFGLFQDFSRRRRQVLDTCPAMSPCGLHTF